VRQGSRVTRRPAGLFGGPQASGAVVTWTLVALNVVAYLVEIAYSKIVEYGVLVGGPAFDPVIGQQVGVAHGQWYRLLTSMFLHETPGSGIGIFHIVFNMWALIVVGPSLERVLGRARYLAVYLLSGLGGAVLFYLVAPPLHEALGASGAIFGLFGAWFVMGRRLRADVRPIVMLIVLNLVITFVYRGTIAWQDHVGGLIAGTALTAAYAYAPRANRTVIQVAATVLLLALIVIGVVLRDQSLTGAARF
jgi:membrane associated rhomboid family serine protease